MRQLGEQWVEELDGKKHMLKAVHNEKKNCNGCVHGRDYNKDSCLAEPKYPCGYMDFIIKDLGVLNEDGCLPCPFCGEYPTVAPDEYGGWTVFCDGNSHSTMFGSFLTKQEAIDEANRRA